MNEVDILHIAQGLPKPLKDLDDRAAILVQRDELKLDIIDSSVILLSFLRGEDNAPARWLREIGLTDSLVIRLIKRDFPEREEEEPKQLVLTYTPAARKMFAYLGTSRVGRGVVKPPLGVVDMLAAVILSDSETVATIFGAVGLSMEEVRARWQLQTSQDLSRRHQ